jgi:ankyrin repeat protein
MVMSGGDKFPLHRAVIQRNILEVESLLDAGADINERDAAGIPPLHYAIHLGYVDVMSFLLKKGMRE